MLYEKNGQTYSIPEELYFKLTDEELNDYLASAKSVYTENPFYDSILEDGLIIDLTDDISDLDIPELPEGFEDLLSE